MRFLDVVPDGKDEELDAILTEAAGENKPSRQDSILNLQELRDSHRAIARFLLRGWKRAEIARHLGVSEATISLISKSPLFKTHMAKLQGDCDGLTAQDVQAQDDEIRRLSQRAVDIMDEILACKPLNDREARLRFEAAKDILDRAGIKAPTKVDMNINKSKDSRELDNVYDEIMREAAKVPLNEDTALN